MVMCRCLSILIMAITARTRSRTLAPCLTVRALSFLPGSVCAVAFCGLTCIVFLVYFPSGLVLLRPDSRSLKESHTGLDCGRDRCRCFT